MARRIAVEVVVAVRRQPSTVAEVAVTVVAVPPVPEAAEERVEAVVRVPLAAVGPPQGMQLLAAAVAVVARPAAAEMAADPLR